jgi:hypothetical protein
MALRRAPTTGHMVRHCMLDMRGSLWGFPVKAREI